MDLFYDPIHYFSSPGLSWDVMLKMTGVKTEKKRTKRRNLLPC